MMLARFKVLPFDLFTVVLGRIPCAAVPLPVRVWDSVPFIFNEAPPHPLVVSEPVLVIVMSP